MKFGDVVVYPVPCGASEFDLRILNDSHDHSLMMTPKLYPFMVSNRVSTVV